MLYFDPFPSIALDFQCISSIYIVDGLEYFLGQVGRNITYFSSQKNLSTTPLFLSSENKFELDITSQIIRLKNHWVFGYPHFSIKVFTTDGTFVKEIIADTTKKMDTKTRILWIHEVFDLGGKKALFVFTTLRFII